MKARKNKRSQQKNQSMTTFSPSLELLQAIQLIQNNQDDAAIQKLRLIIDNQSQHKHEALISLLYCLNKKNKKLEAIDILLQALKTAPDNAGYMSFLAQFYMDLGFYDEAIHFAERTLTIEPDNQIVALNHACWKANRTSDQLEVKKLFEAWSDRFMEPFTKAAKKIEISNWDINKRLKIGYVSGDIKNHSVQYFIEPFLALHDPSEFDLHVFMTMQGDTVTETLKQHVPHWHQVDRLNDQELFTLIRSLEIDILIDLSGHTEGSRLEVFARRAAPIQVTWFGFMQTLGMRAIDYRLTDYGACPPGAEAHYTENLYRLECMAAYQPPIIPETLHPSPYLKNGFITMLSINHSRKILDGTLHLWSEILEENPNSILVIVSIERDEDAAKLAIIPRLEQFQFPMERVSVLPRLNFDQFMNLGLVGDFSLDPFPVSGGTTTLHAMWMGLPVVSLSNQNNSAMSSSSANTLLGIGLSECVAHSHEEYKQLAASWINQPEGLNTLREKCRHSLQTSVLMDHQARVNEVELAYRNMWLTYAENHLPQQ